MTGYNNLLDDIICTAIGELDLTFDLYELGDVPFIDFVIAKSIQLNSIEVIMSTEEASDCLSNPNFMRLIEFHTHVFRLSLYNIKLSANHIYLKFVNSFSILNDLQTASPSLKRFHLICDFYNVPEQAYAGFLDQVNSFTIKHKTLDVQLDIYFSSIEVGSHWRLNSKTQFAIPIDTVYPNNLKDIEGIKQWCSASSIESLDLRPRYKPVQEKTKMVSFTEIPKSSVSTVLLNEFSAGYDVVLDEFLSLRTLEVRNSILNKFPSLLESLRKLTTEFVNDLTVSDMEHEILNSDKLLDLKGVLVQLKPFKFNDTCDEQVFFDGDSTTNEFLRILNTCTIDQLQQFVSQLPSDLETLKIIIDGYIRLNLDNYSLCSPDKISFQQLGLP
ncbi:unnamed protein product [Ambrosiozyma monospora]|uniref:Unnamed protein product n=1 Tax=Ambrosiozyma monospora TaxID=43982 RepID=A0ACB5SY06_AMBMO|nr:unnamed protein product [Ambrosiozyma monospora]